MKEKKISSIIEYIKQGKILSLISDAGTPSISDPGRSLINECIKEKIEIITNTWSIISNFSDECIWF